MTYGSAHRFQIRQRIWREEHRVLPGARHHVWWLVHNVVSHPLLGIAPTPATVWFHDWTSKHLNQRNVMRPSPFPEILPGQRRKWVRHNVVAHIAIGLLPIPLTFAHHDRSGNGMGVRWWV